jgi:ShK domain-like
MMSQLLLLLSRLFLLLFTTVLSSAKLPPLIVVVDDDGTTATTCTSTTTSDGADTHEWCAIWRDKGECRRRFDYMHQHCPVSCATGSNKENEDTMETKGHDDDDDTDVVLTTRMAVLESTIAFGERQRADGEQALETLELIGQTVLYLQSNLASTSAAAAAAATPPPPLFDDMMMMRHNHCRNHHELCAFWAVLGECDINTAYMHTHCGPSCRSCHVNIIFDVDLMDGNEEQQEEDDEERCVQLNTNKAGPALRHPGDLNRLFERIVRKPRAIAHGVRAARHNSHECRCTRSTSIRGPKNARRRCPQRTTSSPFYLHRQYHRGSSPWTILSPTKNATP